MDTKVGEGEGGGAPGSRAEVPLQSAEETTVKQVSTLQLVEKCKEQGVAERNS